MKSKRQYIKKTNLNKISLTNIENISSKRGGDLSSGNLYISDYSTIVTNSNIYNSKTPILDKAYIPLSPENNTFKTIEDYSHDIFYLSKLNLEHDIYISSLKKKLSLIKEERKKTEIDVTLLKKKIFELQKEELKSLKQLENTKRYIKKIIENRKKYTKKNYDIKITKINNIFQTNKSPNHKSYRSNNIDISNTWFSKSRKKEFIRHQNSTHTTCRSNIGNNNSINNSYNNNKRFKTGLNAINKKTIENIVSYSNINSQKIYSRKKVRDKKYDINNKINSKTNRTKEDINPIENIFINNYKNMDNININNKAININNDVEIKKDINNNANNKAFKESLIKKLKKDEEEKKRIQKQIEEIEKEQNNLYSNFSENFEVHHSAKTLDLDGNYFKIDYLK